jgi:hypothetical protein
VTDLCGGRADECIRGIRALDGKSAFYLSIFLVGTALYLVTDGLCWARSTVLTVEIVGVETRDANTLYSVLNAIVTIPLLYIIRLDAFGFSRFGTRGLLWADAATDLIMFAVVTALFVVCGLLKRVPAEAAAPASSISTNRGTNFPIQFCVTTSEHWNASVAV